MLALVSYVGCHGDKKLVSAILVMWLPENKVETAKRTHTLHHKPQSCKDWQLAHNMVCLHVLFKGTVLQLLLLINGPLRFARKGLGMLGTNP